MLFVFISGLTRHLDSGKMQRKEHFATAVLLLHQIVHF